MDTEKAIECILQSLNGMRTEWTAHAGEPDFQDRTQWVQGVVKGLDLAIWVVLTESRRRGCYEP